MLSNPPPTLTSSQSLTVLDDLGRARQAVLSPDEDDEPELGGERRASGSRRWAVADRLAADCIQAVVDGYRAGRTARELAERFKISTTSVKRLVRRRGAGSAVYHRVR
jgi:DNA-directed RNA polymerase specialized sigma24 family protein